jgi:hypothetical protein
MEIIKISKDAIKDIDLPESVNEVYYLKNDLETIGYGFINYDSNNEIEIFIKDEYRGEDCGKELFQRLYDDFERDIINLEVKIENYPMIKIINEYKALDLGTNEGIVKYVIKKS